MGQPVLLPALWPGVIRWERDLRWRWPCRHSTKKRVLCGTTGLEEAEKSALTIRLDPSHVNRGSDCLALLLVLSMHDARV